VIEPATGWNPSVGSGFQVIDERQAAKRENHPVHLSSTLQARQEQGRLKEALTSRGMRFADIALL